MRTMSIADKENASPQLAPTPNAQQIAAKSTQNLSAKQTIGKNSTPQALGAKNRFGYTPSPPSSKAHEYVQKAQTKTLIQELASNSGSAPSRDTSLVSSKQIITELQERGPESCTSDDIEASGATCGAFTVSWETKAKPPKKPVLTAKNHTEKKPLSTNVVKAREPAVPWRKWNEKVGAAPKTKEAAGSSVEKKAVGIKNMKVCARHTCLPAKVCSK